MRIAHVITGLGVGGAERILLDLSSELVSQGHQVSVWSLTSDTSALARGVDSGVRVVVLNLTKNPITWMVGLPRLLWGVVQFSPQVLHAHMFHGLLGALVIKLVAPWIPLVFTSHTYRIAGPIRRFVVRLSAPIRSGDVIFRADQHPALNAKNVQVIPNGIRSVEVDERIGRREMGKRIRFVSVGRFTDAKNHVGLIQQFNYALREGADAELWLVGDGPLSSSIEAEILRLNLGQRVMLLGRRSDVMDILRDGDIFVLASKWEGLPVALLEAGLVGLPVISTPVGSIPSLLADDCGILAQPWELGDKMRTAIELWPACQEMGSRLRQRVLSDYTLGGMADEHIRLYSREPPCSASKGRAS